jgi:patatin-like phospholipase/acyl hydrolase
MRCEVSWTYLYSKINLIYISRGLVSINALRRIENLLGEPIHTMFDYMSGVSTGAVITAMLGK